MGRKRYFHYNLLKHDWIQSQDQNTESGTRFGIIYISQGKAHFDIQNANTNITLWMTLHFLSIFFRGKINIGLFQTLIQMKIRQKIRATATHPELLGKELHNEDP